MRILVGPHTIDIQSNPVNELEINITRCYFEFSEEITNEFVKEAYFTLDNGDTYKQIIVNNECDIPNEVLVEPGTIEVGVVAYLVEDEETIKRYNPKPGYFTSWVGSLKDAENSEPITPSEMEQYEQALQGGLNDISDALDDLQDKVDSGYFKGDKGDKGDTGPQGDKGDTGAKGDKGDKGDPGIQGPKGEPGEPGRDGVNGQDGKDGKDGQDGVGIPSGGTQGQILAKASGTDYDSEWVNSPAPDLSNYYTKSETNTQITNNKTIYEFYLPDNWYWSSSGTNQRNESYFTERDIEQLSAIFEKGLENVIIRLRFNQNYPYSFLVYLYNKNVSTKTYDYFGLYTNYDNDTTYGVRFSLVVNNQNTGITSFVFVSQEQAGYVKTSKIKTATSTTSGEVYDVTYINTMLGNIESLLGGI